MRATRWLDQTILHSEATRGKCMQVAVAGLFGLPLSEVPNFAVDGDRCHLGSMNFADSDGFDLTHERTAKACEGRYLACGPPERGTTHMVVDRDGKLWHDPHPSRAGPIGVEFVDIVEPLDPAIHVSALVGIKRIEPRMAKDFAGPWESNTSHGEDHRGSYQTRQKMNVDGKCLFETDGAKLRKVKAASAPFRFFDTFRSRMPSWDSRKDVPASEAPQVTSTPGTNPMSAMATRGPVRDSRRRTKRGRRGWRRCCRWLRLTPAGPQRYPAPGDMSEISDLGALAGAPGFEPGNGGTKNRCLTTWRRPIGDGAI